MCYILEEWLEGVVSVRALPWGPDGLLASLRGINSVSLTLEAETVQMAFWLLSQAEHESTVVIYTVMTSFAQER